MLGIEPGTFYIIVRCSTIEPWPLLLQCHAENKPAGGKGCVYLSFVLQLSVCREIFPGWGVNVPYSKLPSHLTASYGIVQEPPYELILSYIEIIAKEKRELGRILNIAYQLHVPCPLLLERGCADLFQTCFFCLMTFCLNLQPNSCLLNNLLGILYCMLVLCSF